MGKALRREEEKMEQKDISREVTKCFIRGTESS